MNHVIQNINELKFRPQDLISIPKPKNVMMITPKYFDIVDAINAHMSNSDGTLHVVDKKNALAQWENLKKTYESLNVKVHLLEGVKGLPDMVFCANQSFPYVDRRGELRAILSNMFNPVRHREVEHVGSFLKDQKYHLQTLGKREDGCFFESMGDALWLPGHRFVLGGFGFRTDKRVYESISKIIEAPVAIFELKNSKFYHLDTCLSILNSTTALACRDAFTDEGWELLQAIFENIIEVPSVEADSPYFACNAHCPDEKHVVIQRGCSNTVEILRQKGFVPVEVDTSEYIKSGGSVFCMKLMFF